MKTNVTAAQIAAKYNLVELAKINKTRQDNSTSEDTEKRHFHKENVQVYAIVSGFETILHGQTATWNKHTHDWINRTKIINDLFSIYTVSSPGGSDMLVDKVYLSPNENSENELWCHWATGGKVNLLLAWGWKDEYFLNNRKTWGHDKCSYKITVNNDLATVIKELWSKGYFSDNYADAHWQIKELLKTGEIPEIDEEE